jgi:hypothetical protein
MPYKNHPLKITYLAWNTLLNVGQTGDAANHSLILVLDGVEGVPTNAAVESTIPGVYKLQLTDAEMNADSVTLGGTSSTQDVIIQVEQIFTQGAAVPGDAMDLIDTAIENIDAELTQEHGAGSWVGGSPVGANMVTFSVVTSDIVPVPIPYAMISIRNNANNLLIKVAITDVNGVARTTLDNTGVGESYKLLVSKVGVTFTTPIPLVVSGDTMKTITGTVWNYVTPPIDGCQTVYYIPDDPSLTLDEAISLYAEIIDHNQAVSTAVITGKRIYAVRMTNPVRYEFQLAKGVKVRFVGLTGAVMFLDITVVISTDTTKPLGDYVREQEQDC